MRNHFGSLLADLAVEDRQEIETIPERFVDRALAGDWEGVAELYHPAAIQMPPDQPAVEGRDAIRQALSARLGVESGGRLEDFAVEVQEALGSGEIVYVRAAYRLKMAVTMEDGPVSFEQHGPYINILRRDEAGQWCIYRQIYGRDHPPL
jgi:ketosteroid isomerase-like protein